MRHRPDLNRDLELSGHVSYPLDDGDNKIVVCDGRDLNPQISVGKPSGLLKPTVTLSHFRHHNTVG